MYVVGLIFSIDVEKTYQIYLKLKYLKDNYDNIIDIILHQRLVPKH